MLIGRRAGLPAYVLTVKPLHTGRLLNGTRFAMLTIVDPLRHSPSPVDLAQLFGLSPAETRIAGALVVGKTLAQISADLDIRITTARTQLRSILRKVVAERQPDLIRILWSSGISSASLVAGWLNLGGQNLI